MAAVRNDDGLMSIDVLQDMTKKKRPHAQAAWFAREFGVILPHNSESVIISWHLFEQLEARKAGLLSQAVPAEPERPKLYSLKKSAA